DRRLRDADLIGWVDERLPRLNTADVAMPLNEERLMSTITHPQTLTDGPKRVDREKTDGMLRHTRLANEPREYLRKREELRLAEMEMWGNIERVAALRRNLPTGAEVRDYVFQ